MAAGIRVSVGSHCLHMRLTLRGEYSHVVDLCMCLLVRSILCWDDWLLRKSCFWPCLFLEMSKKNDKKNRKLGWVWLQCYFGSSVWKGHFCGKAVLLFPVSLYHICPVDEKLMLKKHVIWKEYFFLPLQHFSLKWRTRSWTLIEIPHFPGQNKLSMWQKWNSLVIKLLSLDNCEVMPFLAALPRPFKVHYSLLYAFPLPLNLHF